MTAKEINKLCGDDSAFSSEEYQPYITQVQRQIEKKHFSLSEREEKLLSGVHLKEKEIANLINLGLGGLLRELKRMKTSGTGMYANKISNNSESLHISATNINVSADFKENNAATLSME